MKTIFKKSILNQTGFLKGAAFEDSSTSRVVDLKHEFSNKTSICLLFLFGLNACRAEPIAENPGGNWPDGPTPTQEREGGD